MSGVDLSRYRGHFSYLVPWVVEYYLLGRSPHYVAEIISNRFRVTMSGQMALYILRKVGFDIKPIVRHYAPKAPKSRPIDMGGIRDEWQHWTPETNARELGLI